MKYFLGLDNGGTNTKAVLFTETGSEVGAASVDTAITIQRPGFTERDMEEMWRANCAIIRKLIRDTQVDPITIAGVAVCGHGKGLYLWGKDNKPAYAGITSTDSRAWAQVEDWKRNGTEQAVFKISYQHILACQPVALIAWLKDNEPDVLPKVQWVFECKDYVRFRLTNLPMAELTDYSGANFINLATRQYDRNLLRLFGIEEIFDRLPPLCNSSDICGYVTEEAAKLTGLAAGTPVAGGMFDIDACAVGVNVLDERHVCMIAGTWSINEYPSKKPVLDGSVQMNSLFCDSDYYLIEESSATSASNLEWFIRSLLPELEQYSGCSDKGLFQRLNEWVEEISPTEYCPIFLPFLFAGNSHPNAKACFVGISGYHTRKHLIRSIYEGIAFSHRWHFERLLKTRTATPESIRLAGGVIHSAVWSQIFADVMQLPIETAAAGQAGALGCAITAAVATGTYRDLKEAASKMTSVKQVFRPIPTNVKAYERRYGLYRRALEALSGIWADLQQQIEGSSHK